MDITPVIKGDRKLINSYGAGRFIISKKEYANSIIITPSAVAAWDIANTLEWCEALVKDLIAIATGTEVLLIGTGAKIIPLPLKLRQLFRSHNIHADVMDTGAACRTYNVLLSEERKVMAALMLV